jgi:hypothetical protein
MSLFRRHVLQGAHDLPLLRERLGGVMIAEAMSSREAFSTLTQLFAGWG